MSFILPTVGKTPAALPHDPVNDAGLSELIAQDQFAKAVKGKRLSDTALVEQIVQKQILQSGESPEYIAMQLDYAINTKQLGESDWQDFDAALMNVSDEVRNDLIFDPGAWEKHANVLVAAIIALNISRVANAQLRGHFSVMAADAAKAQGAAIVESGKAALYTALTAAVVSGAIAGFAMVKTFQGQGLKHADINGHKRHNLDAKNIADDLSQHRKRDDWNPETTLKFNILDSSGRSTSFDFKPKGSTLTPQEHVWFDGEITKAKVAARKSDWDSQAAAKRIDKKLEIGRALNAMSMSMSQVVSNMVRMTEHAAREKEVLQQSAQNTQKSLSDEVGQKDSAEAALLQKLMDMVMQLFQSRADVIRGITA